MASKLNDIKYAFNTFYVHHAMKRMYYYVCMELYFINNLIPVTVSQRLHVYSNPRSFVFHIEQLDFRSHLIKTDIKLFIRFLPHNSLPTHQ